MCAMIPIFRTLSMATGRSCIFSATFISLVPEVRESFVAFGHPVGLLFALHRAAGVLRSIKNLVGELLGHTLPASLPRETNQPAAGERKPALGADLDRDLVGGAADPPRLDLEQWRRVAQGRVENLQRLLLRLLGGAGQRVVDDLLGRGPLAAAHDDVHELGDRLRLVNRVGRDDTLDGTVAARHQAAALPFSRFAPYFDRAFLRFLVPAVSSVPRMMWYRTPGRS